MNPQYQKLIAKFGQHRIKLNEPLKFYTSSHIEVMAEAFFIATNIEELVNIIKTAEKLGIFYQLLGAGTKINLAGDVAGLVIKNRTANLKISGVKGKVGAAGIGIEEALIEVDSGVGLMRLNQFLQSQNLLPLFFHSTPEATIGGSLPSETQMHQFVQSVQVLVSGEVQELKINHLQPGQLILSAVLKIRS